MPSVTRIRKMRTVSAPLRFPRGHRLAGMDLRPDLGPVDRDLPVGVEPEPHLVAADLDHGHYDLVVDDHALILLAGHDQHGVTPFSMVGEWIYTTETQRHREERQESASLRIIRPMNSAIQASDSTKQA